MKKLVKVEADGTVHELYSEYFIDWKKDHAKMVPIDHPDGSITTHKLRNKVVTTEKIDDSAVTTSKIANSNVTTDKIADLNVTTGKIDNSAVTTEKIANSSVTTSKITDLNVTHEKLSNDMYLRGKSVVVDTPVNSGNNNQYPNTSGLEESYSKTIIDQKLDSKSDINHSHNFDGLDNFPTEMKNPFPLVVNVRSFSGNSNSMVYDGSNDVTLSILDDDVLDYIQDALSGKSDVNHTHDESEITYIDKYTKEETDLKISDLLTRIESLEANNAALEARIQALEAETN